MKNLIWLASYPKSGNTWLRAFLSNLLYASDKPVDLDQMLPKYWANDRRMIEKYADVEPSELTDNEVLRIRPEVYKQYSNSSPNFPFIKIHDAFYQIENGVPLIPLECTFKVVYLVRNPLDIVTSFAHHRQQSYDEIIEFMSDRKAIFGKDSFRYNPNSFEILLSWSDHINSWLNSKTDILVLKYEEMHLEPTKTFSKLVDFLGYNYSEESIKKAISFSEFNVLKKQELRSGYGEKNLSSGNFFRRGKLGDGTEKLSLNQIKQIKSDHKDVMKMFNYE